jgi:hypothetical protein
MQAYTRPTRTFRKKLELVLQISETVASCALQGLKPSCSWRLNVAAEAATHDAYFMRWLVVYHAGEGQRLRTGAQR